MVKFVPSKPVVLPPRRSRNDSSWWIASLTLWRLVGEQPCPQVMWPRHEPRWRRRPSSPSPAPKSRRTGCRRGLPYRWPCGTCPGAAGLTSWSARYARAQSSRQTPGDRMMRRPVSSLCTPGPVHGACRGGTGLRSAPAETCALGHPRRAPAAPASGALSRSAHGPPRSRCNRCAASGQRWRAWGACAPGRGQAAPAGVAHLCSYQGPWGTRPDCIDGPWYRDGENWLAPRGGSRLSPEGGWGVWEMDTCDRTYVWSSLSGFFFTMLCTP